MPSSKSYIQGLTPYQPGMPIAEVIRTHGLAEEDVLKLASNENPLGMSSAAKLAIQNIADEGYRYPEQYDLLQALAAFHKLNAAQFVIGNGSNDVIDLIARTYLGQGDEAIVSEYAFAMYHIANQSAGATTITVPSKDYGHDLQAMLAAITPGTKVIWIANSNNPTGTFIPYEELQQFVEQVPPEIVVVIDEAYYEYLKIGDQENTPRWLADYPNLILIRTFSKIYGLAGLRIGYGMAAPAIAELINRVRQPFNANSLAIAAAAAALQDQAFVVRSYNANAKSREVLLDGLEALEIQCLPAYGNFVACHVTDALQIAEQLLQKGIIVRPLAGYGMADWLRVTVGLPEDTERFLQTLAAILRGRTV
jgi:histidinol-phosphate aminotransferase